MGIPDSWIIEDAQPYEEPPTSDYFVEHPTAPGSPPHTVCHNLIRVQLCGPSLIEIEQAADLSRRQIRPPMVVGGGDENGIMFPKPWWSRSG